jgi:hypothetical protein
VTASQDVSYLDCLGYESSTHHSLPRPPRFARAFHRPRCWLRTLTSLQPSLVLLPDLKFKPPRRPRICLTCPDCVPGLRASQALLPTSTAPSAYPRHRQLCTLCTARSHGLPFVPRFCLQAPLLPAWSHSAVDVDGPLPYQGIVSYFLRGPSRYLC